MSQFARPMDAFSRAKDKRAGCLPDKAADVSLLYDRSAGKSQCSLKEKHPLLEKYQAAIAPDIKKCLAVPTRSDERIPTEAYFKATQLVKPMHVPPRSFIDKLQADVALEKNTRKQIHFSNYLAQLGHSGSFHWPTKYITSTPPQLQQQPTIYGVKKSDHDIQCAYDSIHNPVIPGNAYKYRYKLHREDRSHAKHTGLYINEEEVTRAKPGILTNSDYGRWLQHVYPNERHHNIHSHKSFYRNRGPDAT